MSCNAHARGQHRPSTSRAAGPLNALPTACGLPCPPHPARHRHACRRMRASRAARAAADWDAEMSLFRKRLSSPNQLATMRLLEAQVDVGRVRPCMTTLSLKRFPAEVSSDQLACRA